MRSFMYTFCIREIQNAFESVEIIDYIRACFHDYFQSLSLQTTEYFLIFEHYFP